MAYNVPPYAKFYFRVSGIIASWRATTGAKVKFGRGLSKARTAYGVLG